MNTKNLSLSGLPWLRGLDYLCLEEYSWVPLSLTVAILDRLEILVLQFAIFHFAACAKSREQCRLRF